MEHGCSSLPVVGWILVLVCQCMVNLDLPVNLGLSVHVWSTLICMSLYGQSWFVCPCMVNLDLHVNVWSILVCLSMYGQSWFVCPYMVNPGLPVNVW